jgi:hypothetical protein
MPGVSLNGNLDLPETVFDVVYLPSHQDLADLLNLLRRIKGAV